MTSKPVAQLLEDLGVGKSHSRPYTSDDNPFSEAQFKTMKYRPDYPDRFQDLDQARTWAVAFFDWYNNDHRHSSLGLTAPEMVFFGRSAQIIQARSQVLQNAYARHPERFVRGIPQPPRLPDAVWINPPRPAEGEIAPLALAATLTSSLEGNDSNQSNAYPHMRQKWAGGPTLSSFQESCASNSARPTSLSDYPSTPFSLDGMLVDINQRGSTFLPPHDAH